MCEGVLPETMSNHHVCAGCLWRPAEGIASPGTGVRDGGTRVGMGTFQAGIPRVRSSALHLLGMAPGKQVNDESVATFHYVGLATESFSKAVLIQWVERAQVGGSPTSFLRFPSRPLDTSADGSSEPPTGAWRPALARISTAYPVCPCWRTLPGGGSVQTFYRSASCHSQVKLKSLLCRGTEGHASLLLA